MLTRALLPCGGQPRCHGSHTDLLLLLQQKK
jgi:hypothetical protein